MRFVLLSAAFAVGLLGCSCEDEPPPSEPMPDDEDPLRDVNDELADEGLFLATATESRARADRVLPEGPSEDASHVLGDPPGGDVAAASEERDYGPTEAVQWTVTTEFDRAVEASTLVALTPREWLDAHGRPTRFGRDAETGRWTYLVSSDAPRRFSALTLAWRYASFDGDVELTPVIARRHLGATREAIASLSLVGVTTSTPVSEVGRRARALSDLHDRVAEDGDVGFVLEAPEGQTFEGRALWDALVSVGLRWGDMDLFHWVGRSGVGDDHLFSVGTSTAPGYFLPEEAVAGRLRVRDLDFGFGVARTHEPRQVLEAMLRAGRYLQRRLGGRLVGWDGPLDAAALRARVETIVHTLRDAGVEPGSHVAMMLF